VKKWIVIVIAVAAVAALVIASLARREDAVRVETAEIQRRDLEAIVRASGTIQPQRSVDVSANVIGTIVKLVVAEGQTVQKGDLLLEIDPTEYLATVQELEAAVRQNRANLQLAEASLDKAEQDHQRMVKLFEQDLASEEQLVAARTQARVERARVEAARNALESTLATLERARHNLSKVTLTAPMSGVITKLNVEEGENAIMGTLNNPGTVLLTIADLGVMEAWIDVDETEVVDLRLGQPATVEIDAFRDSTYTGTVTEIGHSPIRQRTGAGQEAVDFEVKITLDETVAHIRPGLTCKAEITWARREDALAVPLGAVTVRQWPLRRSDIVDYDGGEGRKQDAALGDLGFTGEGAPADTTTEDTEGVFVVRDGFAKFVPVTIGIAGEEDFEVLSGLTEGQTVVSGPFRELRDLKDGARVRPQATGEDRE